MHPVGAPFFAVSCTSASFRQTKTADAANRMPELTSLWGSIRNDGGDTPHHHMFLSGKKSAAGTVRPARTCGESNVLGRGNG